MTALSRFTFRLQRRLLRMYEFGLYALLLAMILAVAWPMLFSEASADEADQCGNIHSSAVVISR